jgi:hypothetical protein
LAQTKNDYNSRWKKVDEFEKKGLTQSALQEVLKIYDLAIKESNNVQQIKSSIYQVRYRQMVTGRQPRNKYLFY